MLGDALDPAEIGEVRGASVGDGFRVEPIGADAGQRRVEEGLRRLHRILRRVEHEALETQPRLAGDVQRQGDGLARRLDAGALAAGIAFHEDRQVAPGDPGRMRQAGDGGWIVRGHHHLDPAQNNTYQVEQQNSSIRVDGAPARMLRQREGPSVWSPRRVIRRPYNSSGSDESYPANCSGGRLRQLPADRHPAGGFLGTGSGSGAGAASTGLRPSPMLLASSERCAA